MRGLNYCLPCFTYSFPRFARFANTPSDRDAIALERRSLKMNNLMREMIKVIILMSSKCLCTPAFIALTTQTETLPACLAIAAPAITGLKSCETK